jgi:hypothetical protein
MCIEQGISIDYGKDFAIDIINYPSNPTQSSSLEWDTTIDDKNLDEELAEGLDEELANGLGNDETKLRVGEEYEETSSLEKLPESKNNDTLFIDENKLIKEDIKAIATEPESKTVGLRSFLEEIEQYFIQDTEIVGDSNPLVTMAKIVQMDDVTSLIEMGTMFGKNIKVIRKRLFKNKALLGVVLCRHKTLFYGTQTDLFDIYNLSKSAGFTAMKLGKFCSNFPRFLNYCGPVGLLESKINLLVPYFNSDADMSAIYLVLNENLHLKKKRKLRIVEE